MESKIHISPWMTIGTSIVLMAVVAFLGKVNYNRDRDNMGNLLQEKGAALIRSFEAGTRSGMMGYKGHGVNQAHLQILIRETADQPDISYITIVGGDGIVLAHNDEAFMGRPFMDNGQLAALSPSPVPQSRIVGSQGVKYFEVYKTFLPVMTRHRSMGVEPPFGIPESPYIFIGMDIAPFEAAMAEDLRHNIVMAAIIFSLGMAGLISLSWAQRHARSVQLIRDTRKFSAEVVTNLPLGILVMDTSYRILYTNQAACSLLCFDEIGVKGEHARDLLPESIWALHGRIGKDRKVAEKEICLDRAGENSVPLAVSVAHIHGEDGNRLGVVFVLKDLTEIKALELKTQRIEKMATIGNLAAGIAHEVRNPLSSVKGYATYFASLFEPGSENQKAADLMAEEADRINRVISELLEIARPPDLKLKTIRVEDLIDHSVRIVTHEAEAGQIHLIKAVAPDLPEIRADLDRLTQVLLNIYINAIQAMEGGGRLSVDAGQEGANLVINISDTGLGIRAKDYHHIFDPYFTTKQKGTGLGLAIAQKIVEDHNGSIRIKSRPGRGTIVTLILPLTEKENITGER